MNDYALLFPGQGCQYVGMAKRLYEEYASVRRLFEEANELLDLNLSKLCFEGSLDELTKTENTQPAILVTSVAMFTMFVEEREVLPRFAAGHSLGEISALTCAGVISFPDAVKMVRKRGILMQEASSSSKGTMYAIHGMQRERVEEILEEDPLVSGRVVISNYNSPEQVVISGVKAATKEAAERLELQGARSIKLNVSAPFHCPLMQPAADEFREGLKDYVYRKPAFPVLSNVTARPYTDTTDISKILSLQIIKPVLWQDTMKFLQRSGISTVIDIGPQAVLRNLAVENVPSITAFSYDRENDRDSIREWFSHPSANGTSESNSWVRTFVIQCFAESVCTKNHNWNEEEYHNGVLTPCERLRQIITRCEQNAAASKLEDAMEALALLRVIMNTKRVPDEEQSVRLGRIMERAGENVRVLDPVLIGDSR